VKCAATAIAAALVVGLPVVALAQAGVIVDPENPGAGVIVAPENPGAGVIVDPENPGAGVIVDPENPGTGGTATRPASRPTPSTAPRVVFRGEGLLGVAVDTAHDRAGEDTFETLSQLGMRARVTISERWSATLEGRLSWWTTVGPANENDPALALDTGAWQGRVEPALRDFFVAGRRGRWSWRLGQLVVAWGSSDIVNPANVVNPRDLRVGVLSDPDDATIPGPAVDVTVALPSLVGQFVVVPFFVPDRLPIYGSDAALLRADSPLGPSVPTDLVAGLIDPSLEDVLQPAVQQTHLPEEHPGNASVGTRWTWTWRGLDLSAGAFYGFDRQPALDVAPSVRAWLDTTDERDDLFGLDAETLDVVADVQAGETLVDARYERRLDFVLDGVRYFGPIGVRFDAVYTPQRTISVDGLTSVRRPRWAGTLGVSYESATGDFVVSAEGFVDQTRMRTSDPDATLGLDDLVGVALGTTLSADAVVSSESAIQPLELTFAALTLPREGDLVLRPSVGWAFNEQTTLSAGAVFFHSTSTSVSPADLYDANDAVFVRLDSAF